MRAPCPPVAIVSILALFFAFVPVAAPVRAAPPLDYQDPPPDPPSAGLVVPLGPGQTKGSVPDRLPGTGNFQNLPALDESDSVVVDARRLPLWKAGKLDPVLTNACRLGDFASAPFDRLLVRFEAPDGRGALDYIPPERRHLLVDTRHLAAPNEIYYFKDAGFPTCQVWVENPVQPPRRLNPSGTSLDKADPKARAKIKALVKSWPHTPEPPPP